MATNQAVIAFWDGKTPSANVKSGSKPVFKAQELTMSDNCRAMIAAVGMSVTLNTGARAKAVYAFESCEVAGGQVDEKVYCLKGTTIIGLPEEKIQRLDDVEAFIAAIREAVE